MEELGVLTAIIITIIWVMWLAINLVEWAIT
jgi:hypothetical protein